MKLFLTIKAVLKYLYNNLIELIWVKKVRFSDGTEQITACPNLYDIKMLSQLIAEKGFTFMCKTVRQDLSKNDVPTLYEDIKNKYNKTEIGSYNPAVDNNAHSIQYDVFSGKYYGFFPNPDDFNHLALCYSDTPDFSTKTFVLVNGNYVGEIMYFLGKNINLIPVYYQSLEVYDKNWNYIKTIPDMFAHTNYSPNKFVYDGSFRFVDGSDDNIGHFCKVITISDNVNADVSIRELTFSFNYAWFAPVNLGLRLIGEEKKPIYSIVAMSGGGAYVIDNIFGEVKVCYVDNAYGNCSRVFGGGAVFIDTPTGNVEYGLVSNMEFDSDYNLWYLPLDTTYNPNDHKIDSLGSDNSQIVLSGQALVGNPFINFDYVVTQQGVYNLEIEDSTGHPLKVIPLSFGGSTGFWLGIVNDIFMFSGYMHNYYYRSDAQKEVYTDSYVIDGTTVNINYYKFNDWKICLKDNGTNDSNLDKVYNFLGYLNYWLLDLTNETVATIRDSKSYAVMYVGDNFVDTTINISKILPTRLLPQDNLIVDKSSSSITFDSDDKVKPNTSYQFGELTSLTLDTNSVDDNMLSTTIQFNSGATATSITDNTNISWVDGSTPVPSANKTCLIFIFNNIGFYKEW